MSLVGFAVGTEVGVGVAVGATVGVEGGVGINVGVEIDVGVAVGAFDTEMFTASICLLTVWERRCE